MMKTELEVLVSAGIKLRLLVEGGHAMPSDYTRLEVIDEALYHFWGITTQTWQGSVMDEDTSDDIPSRLLSLRSYLRTWVESGQGVAYDSECLEVLDDILTSLFGVVV